jgi:hypothetical protein|tara:strand:+ start:115 stop:288 length:174 start_codon:yes stop_codon:yes gene_type:complete
MAEILNGKIQIIKTLGSRYRKFANFRSTIFFFNGGLNVYPRTVTGRTLSINKIRKTL